MTQPSESRVCAEGPCNHTIHEGHIARVQGDRYDCEYKKGQAVEEVLLNRKKITF